MASELEVQNRLNGFGNYLDPRKKEDVAMMPIQPKPLQAQLEEIKWQEPFKKTPQQSAFLDYLGGQMYGQDSKNKQYTNYIKGQIENPMDTLAQRQLAESTRQNVATTSSQIGSTRGMSNPALLASLAREQSGMIKQQGGQQAEILKQQEQQANLEGYGQALQNMEQQRLLQQQLYGGLTEQDRQANEDRIRLIQSIVTQREQAQANKEALAQAQRDQLISGIGQAGVMIGAAAISDKNLKTNIASGDKEMDDYLEYLNRSSNLDQRNNSYLDYIG